MTSVEPSRSPTAKQRTLFMVMEFTGLLVAVN